MSSSHRRARFDLQRTRPTRRRQARQLRLLQHASHQIAAALEVEVVLERLVEAICSSLGYQFVFAALVEGDQLVFHNAMSRHGTPPSRCLA